MESPLLGLMSLLLLLMIGPGKRLLIGSRTRFAYTSLMLRGGTIDVYKGSMDLVDTVTILLDQKENAEP